MNSVLGSSSMSAMRDFTPAILSAAIGILAGYTSIAAAHPIESQVSHVIEQSQDHVRVAGIIHALIKDCEEMSVGFRSIIKRVSSMDSSEVSDLLLSAYDLPEYTEKLQGLRDIETLLKTAEVPEPLKGLHLNARRALAQSRSWIVVLHDLTLQAVQPPVIVEGEADTEGLRVLAEHSTKRLIELVQA